MKDFADLDNSSGSFPDVIGVDASGPGETDGTELTADLFNDIMGAFQAILNDVSATPSGSAESGSGTSQILDAIKFLINAKTIIPIELGQPTHHSASVNDWDFCLTGTNDWTSSYNAGGVRFPLNLPVGATIDLDITVRVHPGAARAGSNRMLVSLRYVDYDDSSINTIGSDVWDDTTANAQDIVLSNSSITVLANRSYFIQVFSGNDGATNNDLIHGLYQDVSLS